MTVTRKRKVNRLRKLRITRVDTVDRGAQPDAHIVIAKGVPKHLSVARDIARRSVAALKKDTITGTAGEGLANLNRALRIREMSREALALHKRDEERLAAEKVAEEHQKIDEPAVEKLDLVAVEKGDGPVAAFDQLVGSMDAPTREQRVLKAARLDPGLADRARSELPTERYGLKPPSVEMRKVRREAETGDEEPHVRSDRWRAEAADQRAARQELERRAREMVQSSAATARPMTFAQAVLLVARADPALASRSRNYVGSRYSDVNE